jgi:hypothetical protein
MFTLAFFKETHILPSKVIVSGLQDIEGETWSILNNTYNIENQTATKIIAKYKYAEEDWDGVMVPIYYAVTLFYNSSTDTTYIDFYRSPGDNFDENNALQIIGASKSGNLLNASEITFTLNHLGDDKYTHDFSVKLQ